jgi:hypothetical protein
MLDATKFQHPSVALFGIARRVSRPLTLEEAASVASALKADRFWRLPSHEPERTGNYDGPHWFLEGRSAGGYHLVVRAWDGKQIIGSARELMQLAGMKDEDN